MNLPSRVPTTHAGEHVPDWCSRASVAVTHYVAHDAVARTPRERAAMLRDIGVQHTIWDWADGDLGRAGDEFAALRTEGVVLDGLWAPMPVPADEDPAFAHRYGIVPYRIRQLVLEAGHRGHVPDLWTPLAYGPWGAPTDPGEATRTAELARAVDHLTALADLAHRHGMRVLLTNHGGWAGDPRVLTRAVEALGRRGFTNVGIGFRLHHAHHLTADLDAHLAHMAPYLASVVLSGIDSAAPLSGRYMLPYGAGDRDRWIARSILESGWQGRLVVHALSQDDAKARLLDSLDGLDWVMARVTGTRAPRVAPRITEPAWPPRGTPGTTSTPGTGVPTAIADHPPSRKAAAFFGRPPQGAATPVAGPPPPTAAAPVPEPRREEVGVDTRPTPRVEAASLPNRPAHEALPTRSRLDLPSLGPSRRERRRKREEQEAHARAQMRAERAANVRRADGPAGTQKIAHDEVRGVAPDPYSGALHALLTHLENEGFRGAPRSFGWDEQGRHLVEWTPGKRADHPDAPDDALAPEKVGRFIREMHDALATFEPPADARWFEGLAAPAGEIIVHQDLAPSNLVVRDDGSLVAIDWDAAGPGTRLWDLAQAAHAFAPLYKADADLAGCAARLRMLIDGYGLSRADREELVPLLASRSERMYEYLDRMRITGNSPWVELWERGVGTVWKSDAQWIREHSDMWRAAILT